jgi:hypothetical protein
MVHAELHLEPVAGLGLGDPHHTGIVDEQVDALVRGDDLPGCGTHRRLRGEVQRHQLQ